MKHLWAFVLIVGCLVSLEAGTIPLKDNLALVFNGDSLWHDGDSTSPQTGCMMPDYIAAGIALLHPEFTNVTIINAARSGTTLANQATAIAQIDYAVFSYNLFHGYGTNDIINIGICQATSNGNQQSNTTFASYSNNFQALVLTTNETANVNEGGSSVSNKVFWVALSDPTGAAIDGGGMGFQSDWARMTAATNAANQFGSLPVDAWNPSFQATTNWIGQGDSPNMEVPSGPKAGHLTALGEAFFTYTYWMQTQGTDTNISNALIDYASAGIVGTNHCVVSSVSRVGSALNWSRTNLRLPPMLDIAGTVDSLGNVITNDASAITRAWPATGNFWQYTIGISNLPSGMYQLTENGVSLGVFTNLSFTGTGLNLTTNYNGPCCKQRVETLARYRDIENANRTNLIVAAGAGIPAFGSLAFGKYPTFHGDGLEAQLADSITALKTNSTGSFSAMLTAAQPTTYSYSLAPVTYQPAPFQ